MGFPTSNAKYSSSAFYSLHILLCFCKYLGDYLCSDAICNRNHCNCLTNVVLAQGYIAPSSTDSGCTGSFIYNFYWGELHVPQAAATLPLNHLISQLDTLFPASTCSVLCIVCSEALQHPDVQTWRAGKQHCLGTFACANQCSLLYYVPPDTPMFVLFLSHVQQ